MVVVELLVVVVELLVVEVKAVKMHFLNLALLGLVHLVRL